MDTPRYFYIIRHGETEYNRNGYVQGEGIDAALNELGLKQAEAFFQKYQNIPFDRVYTSKLRRARQSVQKFIDKGITWEAYQGLNEINWGVREGIKTDPAESAYYHEIISKWSAGETQLQIEGGESPQDVANRQKPIIDLFIERNLDENVLVCMHGRAIRILLCQMLGFDLKNMDQFKHANLGLYLLKYQNNTFSIEKTCDTEHLVEYGLAPSVLN